MAVCVKKPNSLILVRYNTHSCPVRKTPFLLRTPSYSSVPVVRKFHYGTTKGNTKTIDDTDDDDDDNNSTKNNNDKLTATTTTEYNDNDFPTKDNNDGTDSADFYSNDDK